MSLHVRSDAFRHIGPPRKPSRLDSATHRDDRDQARGLLALLLQRANRRSLDVLNELRGSLENPDDGL